MLLVVTLCYGEAPLHLMLLSLDCSTLLAHSRDTADSFVCVCVQPLIWLALGLLAILKSIGEHMLSYHAP